MPPRQSRKPSVPKPSSPNRRYRAPPRIPSGESTDEGQRADVEETSSEDDSSDGIEEDDDDDDDSDEDEDQQPVAGPSGTQDVDSDSSFGHDPAIQTQEERARASSDLEGMDGMQIAEEEDSEDSSDEEEEQLQGGSQEKRRRVA